MRSPEVWPSSRRIGRTRIRHRPSHGSRLQACPRGSLWTGGLSELYIHRETSAYVSVVLGSRSASYYRVSSLGTLQRRNREHCRQPDRRCGCLARSGGSRPTCANESTDANVYAHRSSGASARRDGPMDGRGRKEATTSDRVGGCQRLHGRHAGPALRGWHRWHCS